MIDVPAVCVLAFLYVAMVVFGAVTTRWYHSRHKKDASSEEMDLVAGRKLGGIIGIFTLAATCIDGAMINVTAEIIASNGLIWSLITLSFCLSGLIGAILFVPKMRFNNYLTMLEPFQDHYGGSVVTVLYLVALCADIIWAATILAVLGATLGVIVHVDYTVAVGVSAAVTVAYTMFGQMVSVAYTDALQFVCMAFGLLLCIPFVLINYRFAEPKDVISDAHENITNISSTFNGNITDRDILLGDWSNEVLPHFIDLFLTYVFGYCVWQSYFQRIFSVRTTRQAQILSLGGTALCWLLILPSVLLGGVAVTADWSNTSLGMTPMEANMTTMVLPLLLQNFTPRPIAILGMSAIAAATLSSMDSAVLSSASMFSHNIYKRIRTEAEHKELHTVRWVSMLVIGVVSSSVAMFASSAYGISLIAADLVYIVMFPQLTSVLFLPWVNVFGAHAGWITGVTLRLAVGEPMLGLPPVIAYPTGQLFPFRTFTMVCSFVTISVVSVLARMCLSRSNAKTSNQEENDHIKKQKQVMLSDMDIVAC